MNKEVKKNIILALALFDLDFNYNAYRSENPILNGLFDALICIH